MTERKFYSNGKLLISGEYLVLDGAKSLAIPTKFGQDLIVKSGIGKKILWKSFDHDNAIWYDDEITFSEISTTSYTEKSDSVRDILIEILHEAYLKNPTFIDNSDGYEVTTNLTFPKFWGLGTSSTLLNNIAQWLKIDAFELLQKSFGGSGYDIACAQNDFPIIYEIHNQVPTIVNAHFDPPFAEKLYFVYLNRKQSSKAAIRSYYQNKPVHLEKIIAKANQLMMQIATADNLKSFGRAIENHEALLSSILEMKTVKEAFFADFNGSIKSLGGWGGDFILVASEENPTTYFSERGFTTIIPFREMIL